jgi:hypothetical protein
VGAPQSRLPHRLLSTAHPGENRVDSIKEPNFIPHLWGLVLRAEDVEAGAEDNDFSPQPSAPNSKMFEVEQFL